MNREVALEQMQKLIIDREYDPEDLNDLFMKFDNHEMEQMVNVFADWGINPRILAQDHGYATEFIAGEPKLIVKPADLGDELQNPYAPAILVFNTPYLTNVNPLVAYETIASFEENKTLALKNIRKVCEEKRLSTLEEELSGSAYKAVGLDTLIGHLGKKNYEKAFDIARESIGCPLFMYTLQQKANVDIVDRQYFKMIDARLNAVIEKSPMMKAIFGSQYQTVVV